MKSRTHSIFVIITPFSKFSIYMLHLTPVPTILVYKHIVIYNLFIFQPHFPVLQFLLVFNATLITRCTNVNWYIFM